VKAIILHLLWETLKGGLQDPLHVQQIELGVKRRNGLGRLERKLHRPVVHHVKGTIERGSGENGRAVNVLHRKEIHFWCGGHFLVPLFEDTGIVKSRNRKNTIYVEFGDARSVGREETKIGALGRHTEGIEQ
jgi:hypothetical protein